MRVRGRLVLASAYILITVIVALEIPLALTLQRRAVAELQGEAVTFAQATAAQALPYVQKPTEKNLAALSRVVHRQAKLAGARILVATETDGIIEIRADSSGEKQEELLADVEFLMRNAIHGVESKPGVALPPGRKDIFSRALQKRIVAVAVPVLDEQNEAVGAVEVSIPLDSVGAQVRRTMVGLVAIGIAGLLAGLLIALILAGTLSRPLRKLAATAGKLGRGDLSVRMGDIKGSREVEEVARSFDDMATRLEAVVRAQREFAANASHQLRTPLTGIKLRIEAAHAKARSEDVRKQLDAADREVDRLSEIVQRLLTLSKQIEAGGPGAVEIGDAIKRAAKRWRDKSERTGKPIEIVDGANGATAAAGLIELDQILDNLVDNALSYADPPITIEGGQSDGHVYVAVEDRGPGIPEDEVDRVTERFYRGRDAPAGGSGLGLAIVKELAERWGGTITVGRGAAGGTRIEVVLQPAPPDADTTDEDAVEPDGEEPGAPEHAPTEEMAPG